MNHKTLIAGLLLAASSGLAQAQSDGAGRDVRADIDRRIAVAQDKIAKAQTIPVEIAGVLILADLGSAMANPSQVEVKRMLFEKWVVLVNKYAQEKGLEAKARYEAIFASARDRRQIEIAESVNSRLMELTGKERDDTRADEIYVGKEGSPTRADQQELVDRKLSFYREQVRTLLDVKGLLQK
ncbi:MAG: hypothetical protein HY403_07850 [Elusimicrobia bacterium]|nr:hypothetical protein [Elusimicrobiota bacterium]